MRRLFPNLYLKDITINTTVLPTYVEVSLFFSIGDDENWGTYVLNA